MLFENQTAYTSSKNNNELILNGEYELTEKVLNGRTKVIGDSGSVYWVPNESLVKKEDKQSVLRHTEVTHTPVYHIVLRGDTIQSIASEYNVSANTIASLNGSTRFAIGTRIRVK